MGKTTISISSPSSVSNKYFSVCSSPHEAATEQHSSRQDLKYLLEVFGHLRKQGGRQQSFPCETILSTDEWHADAPSLAENGHSLQIGQK